MLLRLASTLQLSCKTFLRLHCGWPVAMHWLCWRSARSLLEWTAWLSRSCWLLPRGDQLLRGTDLNREKNTECSQLYFFWWGREFWSSQRSDRFAETKQIRELFEKHKIWQLFQREHTKLTTELMKSLSRIPSIYPRCQCHCVYFRV